MKQVAIYKRIPAGRTSCFSSTDTRLKFLCTDKKLDFALEINTEINSAKLPFLNGEKIDFVESDSKFIHVSLKCDTTFSYKDSKEGTSPEFKALVKSFLDKGFIESYFDDKTKAEKDFKERCDKRDERRKKKKGLVLWMRYETYKNDTSMLKGGFSDDVFKSEGLQNYLKSGGCGGWIGHSGARRPQHDKVIEAGLKKRGLHASLMRNWITSSSGRHFGDSLEGCSLKEQKHKIKEELNSMYNSCLVYSDHTHRGTYTYTISLRKSYETYGLLLPYDGKYNKKAHVKSIIEARNKLMKENNPELEGMLQIVNTIFANLIAE